MKIVLASRNKKKIKELDALLTGLCGCALQVLSLDDIGYDGDIAEDGESFAENALIKAAVPASMGYIGIADDSGLCVDALCGAPGIYSARYAGEHGDDEANNDKLLRELEAVCDGGRGASFVCSVACVVPEGLGITVPESLASDAAAAKASEKCGIRVSAFTVSGECRGEILRARDGEGGFGYDPLFFVPEEGTTFARLSAERKNEISHRGRAMRLLAEALNKLEIESEIQ